MVNDSNWEPDGVTLQVRFCEGGATYQLIGMRAATLPFCHSSPNLPACPAPYEWSLKARSTT